MTINERLLYLRKDVLLLTQKEMADRLNVTKGSISKYENGNLNLTHRTVSDICKIFRVNKEWIENGQGEIFDKSKEEWENYLLESDIDELDKKVIKVYLGLPKEVRQKFILAFMSGISTEDKL